MRFHGTHILNLIHGFSLTLNIKHDCKSKHSYHTFWNRTFPKPNYESLAVIFNAILTATYKYYTRYVIFLHKVDIYQVKPVPFVGSLRAQRIWKYDKGNNFRKSVHLLLISRTLNFTVSIRLFLWHVAGSSSPGVRTVLRRRSETAWRL
jgi:hypothetical protein